MSSQKTLPIRILNTEPGRLGANAKAALHALGQVDDIEADRDFLRKCIANYNVLFVALRNTLDAELLERASRLSCIVTPTTGLDHIDVQLAAKMGIEVLSLRGETDFLNNVTATAELTWGLLLTLLRRISAAHASVMRCEWRRNDFCGTELQGKTLGVIGHGRLGKMVARYGIAFRMRVLAFDRTSHSVCEGIDFVELDELLRLSDIISLHLPLNDNTRGFLGFEAFRRMKQGVIIINTARSELVEQSVLLEFLQSGHVAAVASDVLNGETSLDPDWLKNNELARYASSHGNVLLTPHIGGVTYESVEMTNLFMIQKLEKFLKEKTLP